MATRRPRTPPARGEGDWVRRDTVTRTFIGNIYKLVKDPNLVSALTGHVEGSRAFARYRDIDDEMLPDLVSKLN